MINKLTKRIEITMPVIIFIVATIYLIPLDMRAIVGAVVLYITALLVHLSLKRLYRNKK
jgi:hypothetical protein